MRLVVLPACLLFISAQPLPAQTAADTCTPEIIRPDKSARSREFLEWLKAHAEETLEQFAFRFEGPSVPNLDAYIADVDNDGTDDYVFPLYEGSGGYLANASIVGENRVVFNIKGNKYRLVVAINYPYRMCYVRFVGSHQAYDRIDVMSV